MHITSIIHENFRVDMTQKSIKLNTASGTTLGPIGTDPLEFNIDNHIFVHNFIVCTKLKQPLILGLHFAQRYRKNIDLDVYGALLLQHDGKKITTPMKKGNPKQQVIASLKTSLDEKQVINKRTHLVTNHTVTLQTYHISVVPLKLVNYTCDTSLKPNTLLDRRNPLSIH